MVRKRKSDTYDEPVEWVSMTIMDKRTQIGGPKGPVTKPGDAIVTVDGEALIIRQDHVVNVQKIIDYFRMYVGALGGDPPVEPANAPHDIGDVTESSDGADVNISDEPAAKSE